MSSTQATWFLSAPETSAPRRRGDPLGLRNITDEVAELLAPGLTNRTRDARWLTLLSWSLVESERAWHKTGGGDLTTADDRRHRYAWLRPLELLWVARSIHLGGTGYRAAQWPGYRSLRRWDKVSARFAMSDSQLNNHRQLGAYGAYRVLFRQDGFTESNDGWTPASPAHALGAFVTKTLEQEGAAPTWQNKPRLSDPAQWWITTGWPQWQETRQSSQLLLSGITPRKLHQAEINILAPLLFPPGSPRLRTAQAIGANHASGDYVALCRFLAKTLPQAGSDPSLSRLGDLAALHDAGVTMLRIIAQCVAENICTVAALARDLRFAAASRAFSSFAADWRQAAHNSPQFKFQDEVNRLAQIATHEGGAFLRRFIDHHEQYGSGARWFARTDNEIILIGAESGIASGNFGYRLHALARLAVQCGVLASLPQALVGQVVDEDDA